MKVKLYRQKIMVCGIWNVCEEKIKMKMKPKKIKVAHTVSTAKGKASVGAGWFEAVQLITEWTVSCWEITYLLFQTICFGFPHLQSFLFIHPWVYNYHPMHVWLITPPILQLSKTAVVFHSLTFQWSVWKKGENINFDLNKELLRG